MPIIELIHNARLPYYKAVLSFAYNQDYVEKVKSIGSFRYDSTTRNWWKIYKSENLANQDLNILPEDMNVELTKISSFKQFK